MTLPSRFKRFLAYLIDGFILAIFSLIIVLPLALGKTSNMDDFEFYLNHYYAIVLYPLMLLYYSFFESSKCQATWGKRLFHLYVSDSDNQRISFSKAFYRCFLWLLPLFPIAFWELSITKEDFDAEVFAHGWIPVICCILYIIHFIPVFGKERKTLYDILTSTRVNKRISEKDSVLG